MTLMKFSISLKSRIFLEQFSTKMKSNKCKISKQLHAYIYNMPQLHNSCRLEIVFTSIQAENLQCILVNDLALGT